MDPEELMHLAIEKSRQGIGAGQSPFGCAIAWNERVVACAHNTVVASTDITAHAEVNALRQACLATGRLTLEGAIVATTCEPCPMCMSALHWARVAVVYFGATIGDATQAGFNELQISAAEIVRLGASQVTLRPGMLADLCRELFAEWSANPSRRVY